MIGVKALSHAGSWPPRGRFVKDEILSYWDMCSRQGMALQRGMYFRSPPAHGVILMSRRPNAPYADELSHDESVLLYEGHDTRRSSAVPDPKRVDQPRYEVEGKPTQNGQFSDWVDQTTQGLVSPRSSGCMRRCALGFGQIVDCIFLETTISREKPAERWLSLNWNKPTSILAHPTSLIP